MNMSPPGTDSVSKQVIFKVVLFAFKSLNGVPPSCTAVQMYNVIQLLDL